MVDQQIIPIYVSLLGDSEPEVRSEAVNRLYELTENATMTLVISNVLPKLKLQMATESSQHVKGTMAFAICKLADKITPEQAATNLIPLVSILLKNNSTEVIVSLVENLEPLVKVIPEATINEKLLPAIVNLSNDKTWRIRLAVVQFLPKLAQHIDRDLFSSKIESTLIGMVSDPVYTIREESTQTLLTLSTGLFDETWLSAIIESKLEELGRHERFMLRIQSIHLMNKVWAAVASDGVLRTKHTDLLNDCFAGHLFRLAADPVPNIRFNVCKTLSSVFEKLNKRN